jgi:2-oxoglutarate ferredoxin oxidoreductase subunit delta
MPASEARLGGALMTLASVARAVGPEFRPTFTPLVIATDRCKGCELCIDACPQAVLALEVGAINALGHHPIRLLDAARCTSCAFCARVCPDAVFTVYARAKEVTR